MKSPRPLARLSLLRPLALGCVGLCASLVAGACSDDGASGCTPGATSSCTGADGCDGVRICNEEGSGYGNCACEADLGGGGSGGSSMGDAGSGMGDGGASMGDAGSAMGAAGDGAAGSAMPTEDRTREVGGPCESDVDCGAPLICASADGEGIFGAGGPPNGYCTMPCGSSVDCLIVDALSACSLRDADGNGFCLARCEPGAVSQVTGLPAAKCVGPGDEGERAQACLPTNAGAAGACVPRCSSDAQCPDGRFCDVGATGLCVEDPLSGGVVGSLCSADTQEADCQSRDCFVAAGGGAFCGGFCTFGFTSGCGFERGDSPREAACLDTFDANGGAGDLGQCFELCDDASDCEQDGFTCQPLNADNQAVYERTGYCIP